MDEFLGVRVEKVRRGIYDAWLFGDDENPVRIYRAHLRDVMATLNLMTPPPNIIAAQLSADEDELATRANIQLTREDIDYVRRVNLAACQAAIISPVVVDAHPRDCGENEISFSELTDFHRNWVAKFCTPEEAQVAVAFREKPKAGIRAAPNRKNPEPAPVAPVEDTPPADSVLA
jgi:hypothetical protein